MFTDPIFSEGFGAGVQATSLTSTQAATLAVAQQEQQLKQQQQTVSHLITTGGPWIVRILCTLGIVLLRNHTKRGLVLSTHQLELFQ